jgi:hypothetical protein
MDFLIAGAQPRAATIDAGDRQGVHATNFEHLLTPELIYENLEAKSFYHRATESTEKTQARDCFSL